MNFYNIVRLKIQLTHFQMEQRLLLPLVHKILLQQIILAIKDQQIPLLVQLMELMEQTIQQPIH